MSKPVDDQPDILTFLNGPTVEEAYFNDPNNLTLGNFPMDIIAYLLVILQETCGRSTLFELSLVNKEFYQLFSPILYENLEITEFNLRKVFNGMLKEAVIGEGDGTEYLKIPAMRLIVVPKPTMTDEEIIESLGCLAICFGPRKPKSKPQPKSGSELKEIDYSKIRNFSKLIKEVERIQNETRQDELIKYQGISFRFDIMSKWERKVRLLNAVKHLKIRDLAAVREVAAYLGPVKEEDLYPNLHIRNPQNYNYEQPLVFQNIKTLSFGYNLLISDREQEKKQDENRSYNFGDGLAELANPPSIPKSINRLVTKMKPDHLCGYWDISKDTRVNKDKMIWLRDLSLLSKIWDVQSFTWHVYQEKPILTNSNFKAELAKSESNSKSIPTDILNLVINIPALKIIYDNICTCEDTCTASHFNSLEENHDPCWRELGKIAKKIDHLGYGSVSSSGIADDDRTIEILGLTCLSNSITPEEISQAAIEEMEKIGFDGTEINLAKRRWSDRYFWTENHFKIKNSIGGEDCVCCGEIEEDKMSNAFFQFGFMMGGLARKSER